MSEADLLHRGVRRVPVVSAGKVVGVVCRSDLVRALASCAARQDHQRPASDAAIHRALLAEMESQPWWHPTQSRLNVIDGVVHFYGLMESAGEGIAARVAADNVPGVQRVVKGHRASATVSQWGYR